MLRVFSDEFRTHRDLYHKGLTTVSVAEAEGGGVWGEETPIAVKWIADPTQVLGARRGGDRVGEFLDSAEIQRRLGEAGSDRWAAVHGQGRLEDGGAFYAIDACDTSAHMLARARFRWDDTNSEALKRIVREVLHGLGEIQTKRGRPHGNLRAGNILIASVSDLLQTRVLLTDPAAQNVVATKGLTELDDLRALGHVLHRLILHKRFRVLGGWPLVEGPEWDAFDGGREGGPVGTAWREFVAWLLDPNAAASERSLLLAHEKLRAIPKPKPRDRWKVPAGVGAAAALLLAVGGVTIGPRVALWVRAQRAQFDQEKWTELVTAYHTWGRGLERYVRSGDGVGGANPWDDALAASDDERLREILDEVRALDAGTGKRGERALFNPWRILAGSDADQEPQAWNIEDLTSVESLASGGAAASAVQGLSVLETEKGYEQVLELMRDINEWDKKARLNEYADSFSAQGWTGAATYLRSLTAALDTPENAQQELITSQTRFTGTIGRTLNEALIALDRAAAIEAASDRITDEAAGALAAFSDPVITRFQAVAARELAESQAYVEKFDPRQSAEPGSSLAAMQERAEQLAQLGEEAAAFVRSGWSRIDATAFARESSAYAEAAARPTFASLRAWLDDAKDPRWVALPGIDDPRRDSTLRDAVGELEATLTRYERHPALDEALGEALSGLKERIRSERANLDHVNSLPWIQGERDRIEGSIETAALALEQVREGEASLDERLGAFERTFIAAQVEGVPPATAGVLNESWLERLAAMRSEFERTDDFRTFHDAALATREYIAKLDQTVPAMELASLDAEPAAWSPEPLADAVRAHRESLLGAAIAETEWDETGPTNGPDVIARGEERMATYRAWRDSVTAMVADFASAEALLDGGHTPWEAGSGGASADALVSKWTADPVYDQARADEAFGAIMARRQRAADLRTSENLDSLARLARGEGDPEAMISIAAWRRLGELPWPTTTQQLALEQEAGDHLLTMSEGLGEVGTRLAGEVRAARPNRWARVAAAADSGDDISDLIELDLEEAFGVDRGQLPSRLRYNVALRTLEGYGGRDSGASEDEIAQAMRDLIAAADAFAREHPGEAGSPASVRQSLARILSEAENIEALDFAEVGPGQIEGWTFEDNNLQTRVVFHTPGDDGTAIEFVQVYRDDNAFFISAEEVSLGLVQDGVRRSELSVFDQPDSEGGTPFSLVAMAQKNWDGPRVWDWNANILWRAGVRANSGGWLQPNLQAEGNTLYAPGLDPDDPGRAFPLNHVSPAAATHLAESMGCRLPTAEEWKLALDQHEKNVEAENWNLRDQTWREQWDYVAGKAAQWQANGGRSTWQFPDSGVFLADGLAGEARSAIHDGHDDGTLWFAPVDEGPGAELTHMIGNVAEFVTVDEGVGYAVIGASAMSPPQMTNGEAYEADKPYVIDEGFNQEWISYADVGFRLAFTVGKVRLPFARSIAPVLDGAEYRFAPDELTSLLGGHGGVPALGAEAGGEGDGGLEHSSTERVTRGENGPAD